MKTPGNVKRTNPLEKWPRLKRPEVDLFQAPDDKERIKRLVSDPSNWLRKVDQLVAARGTDDYEAAAEVLDELREALAGDGGE